MLRWPVPAGLAEQLRAREVRAVERRGKYLLFEVDAGWFIVHLGMTGTLRVLPAPACRSPRSTTTSTGSSIRAAVPRSAPLRRGAGTRAKRATCMRIRSSRASASNRSPAFTGALLHRARARTVSVRRALLAGDMVVGVGNIYASGACFAPASGRRRPPAMSLPRYERLADAVRGAADYRSSAAAAACAISSAATAKAAISSSTASSTTVRRQPRMQHADPPDRAGPAVDLFRPTCQR